jgi:nitrite reductase/ring-hydroxylating ferredoxin subunit
MGTSLALGMAANSYLSEAEAEFSEIEIDFAASLKDGEMRELKTGPKDDDKILISRVNGKLHAVGNFCSHFGAPLSTGQLFDDKVVCPWHAAAFSVVTGALEGSPGIDGLPVFGIVERDGKFFAQIPENLPRKQTQALAKRDPTDKRRFVVIGGGPAGLFCAETLRQSNYTGELVVISAEDMVPYDRTLLTKALPLIDVTKSPLRSQDFLEKGDINYRLGVKAESVDTSAKVIKLSDGTTLVINILKINIILAI